MARNLTEKQQKFLEVLFEEAGGDVVQAKKLSGYGESSSTTAIVESLKDEIGDRTRSYTLHVQRLKLLWLWWVHLVTQQS